MSNIKLMPHQVEILDITKDFKNVAYGISLESALKKVIQYRVSCKRDTTDLSTYLKDFREELDSLKELCGI